MHIGHFVERGSNGAFHNPNKHYNGIPEELSRLGPILPHINYSYIDAWTHAYTHTHACIHSNQCNAIIHFTTLLTSHNNNVIEFRHLAQKCSHRRVAVSATLSPQREKNHAEPIYIYNYIMIFALFGSQYMLYSYMYDRIVLPKFSLSLSLHLAQ